MPFWNLALVLTTALAAPPKRLHLEAETGQLAGVFVSTRRPGYSGTGYVDGFTHDGDKVTLHVEASPGLYEARIRYSSPLGEKGYELVVNGAKFAGLFARTSENFADQVAGKVELKAGLNTVAIEKGWGYYAIDYIELVPAAANPKLRKPPTTPADPQATARARALLTYLIGLYGRKTLSGQYDPAECDYIHSVTGKLPAVLGGDFMDYSPSRLAFGAKPQGTSERLIQSARKGQILTLSWHWNAPSHLLNKTYVNNRGKTIEAPWYRGFYTDATTFDVQQALDHPGSEDYALLLRDMDAIAAQLQKFADADIPILWRPLHEAEGGWFWWGAKGPQAYIRLWKLMFTCLTHTHHLHNLIWVCNCVKPEWYPGDAFVDVVGLDAYPSDTGDPLSGSWDALIKRFDGKKLLALTEFGGVPDVDKMRRYGVRWSYFVSWSGGEGPRKIAKDTLTQIYRSSAVITQDMRRPPASLLQRPPAPSG